MSDSLISIATVLAATEVAPDDWRDLSSLLEDAGGPSALVHLNWPVTLTSHRSDALLQYLRAEIDHERIRHWENRLKILLAERKSIKVVLAGEATYPRNLRLAYGRPPFLFIEGDLTEADNRSLAIVGSRKTSAEGRSTAHLIAQTATEQSITIVSGLALGIDSAAHEGALASGGRTIAVVGVGIDHPLGPDSDQSLVSRIRAGGALVSQFRPGSPATPSTFIARNAIISGLSLVSLLIDATERSGTRSEADHALQQGRRVLLWEPTLGSQRWAQIYARQPGVSFVSTIPQVIDAVYTAETELTGDDSA